MNPTISRRNLLKLGLAGLGSLAFRPFFPPDQDYPTGVLARVAPYSVSVYRQPDDKSQIVAQRYRDEVVNIYYEVISEKGPAYNPLWYRVWGGFMHASHLQRVQVRFNPVLNTIPESGQLGEITVPFTQSLRYRSKQWDEDCYRLYYESTHWIVGIDAGPDGEPWYRLKDELLHVDYHIPAAHMRPIPAEEFAPISTDVDPERKRVEVSIASQTATAFENEQVVFQTKISSGMPNRRILPGQIPTATPTGRFRVYSKMPSKHMGDGRITSNPEAYELPGVPWTIFFDQTGVAFHGTYWHNNFGMQMSHGCVNMRTEEAKWLFRWVTPYSTHEDWEKRGRGTLIIVK